MYPEAAIVLGGGASRRMGSDKMQLPLGSRTLLSWTVDRMAQSFHPTVVVAGQEKWVSSHGVLSDQITVVDDKHLGGEQSPLRGIVEGMSAVSASCYAVTAGDMPFVRADILKAMIRSAPEIWQILLPYWQGHPQPLMAIYHASTFSTMIQGLQKGHLSLLRIFDHLHVTAFEEQWWKQRDPEGFGFFNVNTPEQYEQAQRLMKVVKM